MARKTFKLFVYGTFMDRRLFRWVTGRDYVLPSQTETAEGTVTACEAILAGHRKISPDGMYLYAIPQRGHRINGYLISDLPTELLELLDHYEGKRYVRTKVRVQHEARRIRAFVYLANEQALRQDYGDRFRINLKHEHVITKRVEEFLDQRAADLGDSAHLPRYRLAAEEELRGLTIRDLVRARLESGSVADYFLRRELSQPLASIRELADEPEAHPYIRSYLDFIVRQVLFNQTEQKFLEQFRFDLDHMGLSLRFYEHTTSSVAALRMLNNQRKLLDELVHELLKDFDVRRHDLLDIVAWSIHAAESLYDPRMATSTFRWIRENLAGGLLPLGAELEFSNVGHSVIADYDSGPGTKDEVFDGFRYFPHFALPALTWKLGGHVDDHQAHRPDQCLRGFLEFSPGAFSTEPKFSVPATKDPWLLGQLILQMVRFYPVKPHSLHLSIQLLRQHSDSHSVLPLEFAKCLLALGGDPQVGPDNRATISRMSGDEIGSPEYKDGLIFSRRSRRRATAEDQQEEPTLLRAGWSSTVQQFKFMRLGKQINYETLILALKGLQLALNLGDYITPDQLECQPGLVRDLEELAAWSRRPEPISEKVIGRFCATIFEGLSKERHGQLAHTNTYVQWALDRLAKQMAEFNQMLSE